MALSALALLLAKEIGTTVATRVLSKLKSEKTGDVESINKLVQNGASIVSAFQQVFGVETFDKALSAAVEHSFGAGGWTYEAGGQEYVRIVREGEGRNWAAGVLREELNLNLDRVTRLYGHKNSETRNYFLGIYRQWQTRYIELIGLDEDSTNTFKMIDQLLDEQKKSFADAFKLLQKTGLGVTGAMLVIQAVLLATSTGVGIFAVLTTWAFGIPMAQVGAFGLAGVLLIALAKMDFMPTNAQSATIAVAYKLLDRKTLEK